MVLRPGDGEELDRDVPLWRKPEGRVTSGGARREAGGVAYLGQDKPRGWSWVPRAARMGTDQALWSCWLHRLWFSWFHPEVFLRGKVLTKALSTHQAGCKQMLLPPGQRRRAVCSCYLLFWRWGDARALVPCPSCWCYRRCRSAASSSQCGVTGLLCFDGYIWNILLLIMQSICFSSPRLFVWMLCRVFSMDLIFLEYYMLIASNFLLLHLLGHFNLIIVTAALLWNVLCLFWFFFSVSFKYLAA